MKAPTKQALKDQLKLLREAGESLVRSLYYVAHARRHGAQYCQLLLMQCAKWEEAKNHNG